MRTTGPGVFGAYPILVAIVTFAFSQTPVAPVQSGRITLASASDRNTTTGPR